MHVDKDPISVYTELTPYPVDKVVAFDLRAVVAPRMVVTAAGGGAAESGHGIEFRTLGLFQVEMRDAPTLQQLFFVMSSFVGHHRLVGLLELVHEIFDIVFQVGCRTGLFSVGGSIG